jgi:hypothetical protein
MTCVVCVKSNGKLLISRQKTNFGRERFQSQQTMEELDEINTECRLRKLEQLEKQNNVVFIHESV